MHCETRLSHIDYSCCGFVSSDRSSYSDGGLLYKDPQAAFFEILSISANIFSFFLRIECILIIIDPGHLFLSFSLFSLFLSLFLSFSLSFLSSPFFSLFLSFSLFFSLLSLFFLSFLSLFPSFSLFSLYFSLLLSISLYSLLCSLFFYPFLYLSMRSMISMILSVFSWFPFVGAYIRSFSGHFFCFVLIWCFWWHSLPTQSLLSQSVRSFSMFWFWESESDT